MDKKLKSLMQAENRAYDALMRDPAVIAEPTAPHTPALWDAYVKSAEAERQYREALLGIA